MRRSEVALGTRVLVPSGIQLVPIAGEGAGLAVSFSRRHCISLVSYSFFSSFARSGVILSHALSPGSFSSRMSE